jgi:long-chain fatty acid transport protein
MTLIALTIASLSNGALAAGFALNSQSANTIGRAVSGDAAIGDNAAILARNPAGMALFESKALSVGLSYADVSIEIKDPVLTRANGSTEQLNSIDDAGSGTAIPNIYYIQPVDDKWAFGFAGFTNFGTGSDTFSLVGAPDILVGNTDITTANLNASASYRINDHFSIGLGVDLVYGAGELGRGSSLNRLDNLLKVEGSGFGFGGIIGALWEINDNNRFGISYRYSPTIDAKGDVDVLTSATGVPLLSFDSLEVPVPDIFQFAGFHQLTDHWAVHYTAQWTGWSAFDSINALDGTSAIGGSVGDVELKEYAWKDSWLYSVGGTWTINPTWTVRAGYLYDNGVVDKISSLSIPDSDRQWFTAGFGVKVSPKSTLDFALAYVKGEEVEVTEAGLTSSVTATTLSNAVYYSMQYSYSF